ncbi:ribonuclease HII [Corynebacterium tapiri]|uniref:Ribonuclease HII n=1 Tax=Corynebacterium tapiri TaxID=1448266 RepID=A0A5C4U549_9CORY|nr:ribonuclease HII [Corynebacterium tapiri]TNL99299.1 ribonuclease HII [Corynebacterium tapiri]
MERIELALNHAGLGPVAGVDEAGRGACAGPVTVAACILPRGPVEELKGLTDSKKLTPKRREALFDVLREVAVAYHIVHFSPQDVDRRGISAINLEGMRQAVFGLSPSPGYVLTDAWHVPGLATEHLPVIGGDANCLCIAAASVLAKVSRDRLMAQMDQLYPQYGFAGHKGYGTVKHMDAVRRHGASPIHRYTYRNVATAHAEWAESQ